MTKDQTEVQEADIADTTADTPEADGRPILVSVDFSPDSEQAMAWAYDMAGAMDAPVLALHVAHDPLNAPGLYKKDEKDALRPLNEVAEKMMQKFLDKMANRGYGGKKGPSVGSQVVTGIPVTRILEVAEQVDARMIVMGRRGRSTLEQLLLGSKADNVLKLSPIPVVIIKG